MTFTRALANTRVLAVASLGLLPCIEHFKRAAPDARNWLIVVVFWGAVGWAAVIVPSVATLVASAALAWGLVALAAIDLRAFRLPDALTLPLTVVGLAAAAVISRLGWVEHLAGAVAGYAAFVAVGWIYRRLRGREGLGLGDAKLLAVAGAWLGWRSLPSVVLIGAVCALIWALALRLRDRERSAHEPLAFGAPLCLAIWWTWLYGPLEPQFS